MSLHGWLLSSAALLPFAGLLRAVARVAAAGGGTAGSPSDAMPTMDGIGAPGVSVLFARGDHQHPVDPGSVISATAPPSPNNGNLWFDTVGLTQYTWYNDGTSSQWVPSTAAVPGPTGPMGPPGPGGLPSSGGTMTGPLNYTATGGNTSRSAQDRAAEWTNVKDFGAKMDGVTDDYAAVTAAIATLVAGDTLYFPPSPTACMLSQCITLPSFCVVWALPGTVTIKPTTGNTSAPLLLQTTSISSPFTAPSNVVIYGITFDGGGQDFGVVSPVTQAYQCNGITLDHCTFQNTRGIAFNGSRINDLVVRACTFNNVGNHWKTTNVDTDRKPALVNGNDGGSTWGQRTAVTDCYFTNIGLDCCSFGTLTNVRVVGNTFNLANQHTTLTSSNYPAAVFALFCANMTIASNVIASAAGNGIDVPGTDNLTVSNNVIRSCGGAGVGVFDGAIYTGGPIAPTNWAITGNVIQNNGQNAASSFRSGISFYHTGLAASGIRIANNVIGDTQGAPTQQTGIGLTTGSLNPTQSWIDPSNIMVGNVIAAVMSTFPTSVTSSTNNALMYSGGMVTFNGGLTVANNGTLTVGANAQSGVVSVLNAAGATTKSLNFQSAGLNDWTLGELGSGTFVLTRFNPSGTEVDNVIQVSQTTGLVTMVDGLTISTGNLTISNGTLTLNGAFSQTNGGIQTGPALGVTFGAGGPTIRSGAGAATGTQPNGSLWLRNDGTAGARLYVSAGGGTWAAVAGV